MILLHSRLEVRDKIAGLPMLLLDATMPVDVVRYFLPRLDVLAEVRAAAPHMGITQIVGGWGKTSLVPSEKQAPEENRRRQNLVGELVDFARLNSGGNALVVSYEAIEQHFAVPGIRTGHFNAIAGLDSFRDVRSFFVIGRPLPDGRELRAMALALTGRPIQPENGERQTRGALMADGSGAAVVVRAFTDPDLEALRVAITESEVIQAIGRGRGVNRDADSPLSVFILADIALPLPLTRLVQWDAVRLNPLSRMAARGRVLLSPTDAAKAYPDLFPNTKAAEYAIGRAKRDFPLISLGISILGKLGGNRLTEVGYRPTGRGQQERVAWVAPELLETFPVWLTALIGPLAHYAEHVPDPPPPPPMADKPQAPPPPPPSSETAPALEPFPPSVASEPALPTGRFWARPRDVRETAAPDLGDFRPDAAQAISDPLRARACEELSPNATQ